MNDESSKSPTGAEARPETAEHRWGEAIAPERERELEARLTRWETESGPRTGRGPFDRVRLAGADVFFLATLQLAHSLMRDDDVETAMAMARRALGTALPQRVARSSLDLVALQLEGANLTGAHLERAFLGGIHFEQAVLDEALLEGSSLAGAHLEDASLRGAHLEDADLAGVYLRNAILDDAHLERAYLTGAHLEGATLARSHLEGAQLDRAQLVGASLDGAYLDHASLAYADLEDTALNGAHLTQATLTRVHLRYAYLVGADLTGASLRGANLQETHFDRAHLEKTHLVGADFRNALLLDTQLNEAHLERCTFEGTALVRANLQRAFLSGASFDKSSRLHDAVLSGASFDQAMFDATNLTVVDWRLVDVLGDERTARAARDAAGKPKPRDQRTQEYAAAVRANRALAVALRSQGLSEDASRFAYRAQLLQQRVLWRQRRIGAYVFSRFLDGLAGYGYKPLRGLFAYVCVVLAFAFAYGLATHGLLTLGLPSSSVQPLQWYEALVLSISAFHGRGFFQPVRSLGDPVAILAAAEAVMGLLIEISLIATFTQRFFGST